MQPYLIGVAGPSCAGKSEVSRRLASILRAPIVSLDSYYRDMASLPLEVRARSNFDHPDSLDRDLLFAQVKALSEGRTIEKPVYDFASHTRADELEIVQPGSFAIVEGLFALYWEDIRRLFQLSVFITASNEVCYTRRLERDIRERGRTPESVLQQYNATVRPMAEQYVLPARHYAHLVLDGTRPIAESAATVLERVEAETRSFQGGFELVPTVLA